MDGEQPDGADAKPKRIHSISIVDSHMPAQKEKSALEIAIEAVDEHKQLMDIASHIKTKYDKQYPGSGKATEGVYHAIVGSRFASTLLAGLGCAQARCLVPKLEAVAKAAHSCCSQPYNRSLGCRMTTFARKGLQHTAW